MKIKLFILFIFLPLAMFCQEKNAQELAGSWMGTISTDNFSLRVIFRFVETKDRMRVYLDSPDQGLKDLPLDKVWISDDSVFVDATQSLNAGIIFSGKILPGDSVISGKWGGAMDLDIMRTDYVFTLKTNTEPAIEGYKIIKLIETTPLKDQQITGTCWSYATTSFIETEAIRAGKKPVILSPMFYVTPTYIDKGEKYIRMNGKSTFSEGDLTFSVLKAYNEFGAIPEFVYNGNIDSPAIHDHSEMNRDLLNKVQYFVKEGMGKMTRAGYRNELQGILTKTMGTAPDTFLFENKIYTPVTFAKEMVGINTGDYIEITSYTHHPFYSKCILEIESNWNNNYYLNLPLSDLTYAVDYALSHNYSVCWDGDIYEGYNDGFAVLPDSILSISQEERQTAFDNLTTKDVHNMHIIGIAENKKGEPFYIVKNSSNAKNCGGYLYMSKPFLQLKTISVMMHKDGLPPSIKFKN